MPDISTAPALESLEWHSVIIQGFKQPDITPDTTLATAVSMATSALEQHLLNSASVRDYLEALPKGPGTDCPDSKLEELVKYVANQKGFIEKKDPALTLRFLMTYILPVFELERNVVLDAIGVLSDVSNDEWAFFHACDDHASTIDRLWAAWFAKVTVPYQSLDEAGKKKYEEQVCGTLAHFDYTAFDYDSARGCVNRRTWAEAFPEEMSEVVRSLDELETVSGPEMAAYFTALKNAYACVEIDKLEELWAKVDQFWIRVPKTGRLVPVHGMESGYEHPYGVSQEFRLEVRTSEGQDVIESRRAATLAHAAAFRLGNELVSNAVQKLERIDISVFVTALRSGTCLNFRYAGQAVPNRHEVLAEGGRIFLDKSAQSRAAIRYIENLAKHCVPATIEALSPLITGVTQLEHTATHEYAHPVGRTKETDDALGSNGMKLLEEAKATLFGILADEHYDPSPEHRLVIVANMLGRVLRFMNTSELESDTFAPYVRENLVAATTLFDSGVISLGPDGVSVDLKLAQSPAWFDLLRGFNRLVLNAYKAHNHEGLEWLTERYCNRSHPQVAALIEWVNRV